MSTLPASTQANLPIRELILDAVGAAIDGLCEHVYRHREGPFITVWDDPAIIMVDNGDAYERRIQHLYEARMQLELRLRITDYNKEERRQDRAQLRADVESALKDDETWGGLAITTTVQGGLSKEGDAEPVDAWSILTVEILYRTELDNPYLIAEL